MRVKDIQVPPGFAWSHAANRYEHPDGRYIDGDSGEAFNKDGSPVTPVTVPSTSDLRTTNNVMRHEYRILSEEEKEFMRKVKDFGAEFYAFCDRIGQSRELSLAKTNIEQAVMWAVKHITK